MAELGRSRRPRTASKGREGILRSLAEQGKITRAKLPKEKGWTWKPRGLRLPPGTAQAILDDSGGSERRLKLGRAPDPETRSDMKDPYKNKKLPRLTVDAWVRDRRGRVLLVRRGRPPFQGSWSLPGGFCEWKETTEACCARETEEETGLEVKVGELLGVYSDPDRDPRGHNVTVLYQALPLKGRVQGGDDAAEARWFTPREVRQLEFAFDHAKIVREQLRRRVRGRRRG